MHGVAQVARLAVVIEQDGTDRPEAARLVRHRAPARDRAPQPVLAVSGWLSPAARAELRTAGVSWTDATGNVALRLDTPLVVITGEGAARRPTRSSSPRADLVGGAKALRVVRRLVAGRPPWRVRELATEAAVSPAYASRLATALAKGGLVGRDAQGKVVEVDWPGLLRRRAVDAGDLLRRGAFRPCTARRGMDSVMPRLADLSDLDVAVTGALAAEAVVPTTEVRQVLLWAPPDLDREIRRRLALLRGTGTSGDVLLLDPVDEVVLQGRRDVDGMPSVALPQLVLDCLAGNGRLPS